MNFDTELDRKKNIRHSFMAIFFVLGLIFILCLLNINNDFTRTGPIFSRTIFQTHKNIDKTCALHLMTTLFLRGCTENPNHKFIAVQHRNACFEIKSDHKGVHKLS